MSTHQVIRHVIPQIGLQEVPLYPPADKVYLRLQEGKEITRLNRLRHLGALSHALPGTRQARWDYTVAILYYVTRLKVPGMSSKFKIDSIQFSSAVAALQTIALIWNIGHLPGTFSVEKGVYRYLHRRDRDNPAAFLPWPYDTCSEVDRIKTEASRLLTMNDYLAIARVLAVIKLLRLSTGPGDFVYSLTCSFAAPFLLEYDNSTSHQWPKLRKAFKIARHLAYLTLDSPFSGLQWGPSIPALLEHQIGSKEASLAAIEASISEILSPIERMTYNSVYHSDAARKETSIVAEHVLNHLSTKSDPSSEIDRWLRHGLFQRLRLGREKSSHSISSVASIKLRSHFSSLPESAAQFEESLKAKRFSHPLVFEYKAWNSETLLEPDKLIIDAMINAAPTPDDVGRFIIWIMAQFENFEACPSDIFYLTRKAELEGAYISMLKRAVDLAYPDVMASVEPWRLQDFGILSDAVLPELKGGIWASTARLDDPIVKHILRDRTQQIPDRLRDQYAELSGIRELRLFLRRRWTQKELRQRWLVLTGSVKFGRGPKELMEFDGGLVKVSSRSGQITWYGLESKRKRKNPLNSLNRRSTALGINGKTSRLSNRYAFLELPL